MVFVTVWWSLWALYDLYLTPYSPVPELAVLTCTVHYRFRAEASTSQET